MTFDLFTNHLRKAASCAVRFGRRSVLDRLPDVMLFRVFPNCSFDGNPLVLDETTFPNDELPPDTFHGPWSLDEVVEFV